jgi:hypothetical protein
MSISWEEIQIVHFSAKEKPRDFLFDRGKRTKEEFKEYLVKCYLKQDYAKVSQDQRSRIGRAIDEWFQRWDEAWDWVMQRVAVCTELSDGTLQCPACLSKAIFVSDPVHCFFQCPAVAREARSFEIAHTQELKMKVNHASQSPMNALRNPSAFPWSLRLVSEVCGIRNKERAGPSLSRRLKDQLNRLCLHLPADFARPRSQGPVGARGPIGARRTPPPASQHHSAPAYDVNSASAPRVNMFNRHVAH